MKPIRLCVLLASALLPLAPAFALKVTNLDHVTQTLEFEAAGTVRKIQLAPDETQIIAGTPPGFISLLTAAPNKGSAVQTQGILRNYIGNGRNQRVPADSDDQFVVWPGGDLVLQRRLRQQKNR